MREKGLCFFSTSWFHLINALDSWKCILPVFILGGFILHGTVSRIDYVHQYVLISIRPAFIPNH